MRYTVALRGFSDPERGDLASFFRLAQGREPAYDPGEELELSDFVLADADQPQDVAAVREADRLQDAVFIGAQAPEGAGAHLLRPFEPTHIQRALDRLVQARLRSIDETAPDGWSAPPRGAGNGKAVLVVDDSRIARRFLQGRLHALGYRVQVAADGAQALEQLSTQSYAIVFLDIHLGAGGLDGLTLCQQVKRGALQPGGTVPAVVLVTGGNSQADRVRGDLAGCDAYLTKPLVEAEFMATLRRLDPDAAVAASVATPPASGVG